MKICYLCPDLGITIDGHKGASSHIRGFVSALTRLGHQVTIASPYPPQNPSLDLPCAAIPLPEVLEGILQEPDPRTYRALRHLLFNAAIEQFLKTLFSKDPPDLVYERYSPFSAAGGILCQRYGIPHILEVNAPLAEQGKTYRKQALQEASELLEATALQRAGMIITLTDELKEWLISKGIPAEKIKIRPCGVDPSLFRPEGTDFKHAFKDKIVLGFVGSLKPWHDIELLCALFRTLSKDPKYHLMVVGDGPMRKLIAQLNEELPGKVSFVGAVDQQEVPKYIRTMDIALAPYPHMDLFYFSPLKVFEYMAMGKPTVATQLGQLNTLVSDGVTGFLIPPGNQEAWIASIETLAANPDLRCSMGRQAFEEVQRSHTWDNRAAAFLASAQEYLQR